MTFLAVLGVVVIISMIRIIIQINRGKRYYNGLLGDYPTEKERDQALDDAYAKFSIMVPSCIIIVCIVLAVITAMILGY